MNSAHIPVRARRVLGALALAGVLALAGAQGAAAGPAGPTQFRVYGPSGTVTLACDNLNAGTHPHAKQACAEIDAARGDIAAIPPVPGQACLPLYDPVLIGVTGMWRGQFVLFSAFKPHASCARIAHGHLFQY